MSKKKRTLKNEALLTKVGVEYKSFVPQEIATILNQALIARGFSQRYNTVLNNLNNPAKFVSNLIKYGDFEYDDLETISKSLTEKQDSIKENTIKQIEKEIKENQKKLELLKK